LLASAIRPDCSPDRRAQVAIEQRAFRLQLALTLLQRPARTADLEQLRVREQNPVGRPVYIADAPAVISDAQEPPSQVDKFAAVLAHVFIEQRPGVQRASRSCLARRDPGHQLDVRAFAFQQRTRKLAIGPR
jgi:hypothetical protein